MNEDKKNEDNMKKLEEQVGDKKLDLTKKESKVNPENKKVEENNLNKSSSEKMLDKNSQERKSSPVKESQTIDKKASEQINKTQKPNEDNANKTLTSSTLKEKKAVNPENKQNNIRSNRSDPNNRFNEQSEYIEKLVSINRVAKVVKGGRRFSFAALVVVGDGNGMVGHGKGKAKEVPEAIKKATEEAKGTMIRVPLRQGRTLHHDIKGRFDSGKVYLRSAPSGTGVIAGGPMRAVFEALGIQDIVAKSVGTSNPHNMVRATFEALKSASSPKIIAVRRGLKINDITKRRKVSQGGDENAKN